MHPVKVQQNLVSPSSETCLAVVSRRVSMAERRSVMTVLVSISISLSLLVLFMASASGVKKPYGGRDTDWIAVEKAIRRRTKADVYVRSLPEYEVYRTVANGGCNHIYPELVVRPDNAKDLAEIVKITNEYNAEISVRSGGHSYQCQGVKDHTLNIDMRKFNKVKIVSPYEAIIGAGNTWADVFDKIDREKYTYVHGQCEQVGVAGFVLGLGFHLISISDNYGAAADNVIEYTMVMADGSIVKVNNDNTTFLGYDYHPKKVIPHEYSNDLKFALRHAGSSYGILTEIRYKIYPRPETLPVIVPIFIEGPEDFRKMERVAASGKYSVMFFESHFIRQPELTHGLSLVYQKLPRMLRVMHGKEVDPVFFSLADLDAGRKGDPAQVINFLKYHGLKVAMDNPGLMRAMGLDGFDLGFPGLETGYLTDEELEEEGFAVLASANIMGLKNTGPLDEIFFHHPVFGIYNKYRNRDLKKKTGCEFCVWFYKFFAGGVNYNQVPGEDVGRGALNFDCGTNAHIPGKGRTCSQTIAHLKSQMTRNMKAFGQRPYQYVNTPSCDKDGPPFQRRYWGNNYEQLLKIKEFWDPHRKFNFCQSVGNDDNDCCPIN